MTALNHEGADEHQRGQMTRAAIFTALLAFAACSEIPLSPGPGPAVQKDTGPLTVPPDGVRKGTAE